MAPKDGDFGSGSGSGDEKTTVIVSLDDLRKASGDASESRVPILKMSRGVETGRHFILQGSPSFVLGRSSECAIVIPDASCSRKHAEVFISGSKIFVKDLGSTNGTHVNEVRLTQPRELVESDVIRIGDNSEFSFEHMRTSEAEAQVEIYDKATRDSLTRTYNRRFFEDTFGRDIQARNASGSGLGLILFDIDHFKKVNDTHGHPAGDAVLREIGKRMPSVIRGEDIFARVGGEEFALILRTNDDKSVWMSAERLRVLVASQAVEHDGKKIPITISVGSCFVSGPTPAVADKIYKITDEALYEAKHGGRNRCVNKTFP
ncbi:MAG: GGDEF domain-containing protein [Bdellovibrionota bacterium]